MAQQTESGITWLNGIGANGKPSLGFTFNPWWGCVEVSPACDNCYAREWANRFGTKWGKNAPRKLFGVKHWAEPLKWQRMAEKGITQDERHPRVFCASMADVFEDNDTISGERQKLWELIKQTPNLIWLLLTKRPHLMTRFAPPEWANGWPDNVWPMTTVENQVWANARIPFLMQVPARVRGLSIEPVFENVILPSDFLDMAENAWIITGGESGDNARPGHPHWYEGLLMQAQDNGNTFHFKQWGNHFPLYAENIDTVNNPELSMHSLVTSNYPKTDVTCNVCKSTVMAVDIGKKKAGRLLQGFEWNGVPPLTLTQAEHAYGKNPDMVITPYHDIRGITGELLSGIKKDGPG